jgi:hypothetical protein
MVLLGCFQRIRHSVQGCLYPIQFPLCSFVPRQQLIRRTRQLLRRPPQPAAAVLAHQKYSHSTYTNQSSRNVPFTSHELSPRPCNNFAGFLVFSFLHARCELEVKEGKKTLMSSSTKDSPFWDARPRFVPVPLSFHHSVPNSI